MRTQKRLALALFVSIAVNLFLAGMLATILIRNDGDRGKGKYGRYDRGAAMDTLSKDSRAKVKAIWRENKPGMRDEAKARRQLRRQMREILLADIFDRARYEAMARSYHERSIKMRQARTKAIAETAAALTAEERKKYFEKSTHKRRRH